MPASKPAAKKTATPQSTPKTTKKVTLDDVWATIERIGQAHRETEKAMQETQKALKETQRIVGDLGNRFGDMAERMLVPDLVDKFARLGFAFGKVSHNVKWKKKAYNLSMELDALLENGSQAMVVEAKAKLDKTDVDEQIDRMEKVRRYADMDGDTRQFFAAMAAMTASDTAIKYALAHGFYLIMPSVEDVKITKPTSEPRVW
jgi:hypothetical protein